MNKLDKDYQALLQDIIYNGVQKGDRTGTGTISVFGRQIRHKMSDGFPLLTTKKMAWNSMVAELIWFLRGDTNIKYLLENNCHIWDGDAYKAYTNKFIGHEDIPSKDWFINEIKTNTEFAEKFGGLGPIYGHQWRKWEYFEGRDEIDYDAGVPDYRYYPKEMDQILSLIIDLKKNPDSRRLMVSAWNAPEIDMMTLPPCHYGFQVYTRELSLEERIQWVMKNTDVDLENLAITEEVYKETTPKRAISLMWNQRSVDTFLGLPFNIASYGLLLEIIAKIVNMVPDELIGNLGDTHLYSNHIEQAKEQIGRNLTTEERQVIFEEKGFDFQTEFKKHPARTPDLFYDNLDIPERTREPYKLPTLKFSDNFLKNFSRYTGEFKINGSVDFGYFNQLDNFIHTFKKEDFVIENYQSHPTIKAPLSN
jgi:thymidylate synthase